MALLRLLSLFIPAVPAILLTMLSSPLGLFSCITQSGGLVPPPHIRMCLVALLSSIGPAVFAAFVVSLMTRVARHMCPPLPTDRQVTRTLDPFLFMAFLPLSAALMFGLFAVPFVLLVSQVFLLLPSMVLHWPNFIPHLLHVVPCSSCLQSRQVMVLICASLLTLSCAPFSLHQCRAPSSPSRPTSIPPPSLWTNHPGPHPPPLCLTPRLTLARRVLVLFCTARLLLLVLHAQAPLIAVLLPAPAPMTLLSCLVPCHQVR